MSYANGTLEQSSRHTLPLVVTEDSVIKSLPNPTPFPDEPVWEIIPKGLKRYLYFFHV